MSSLHFPRARALALLAAAAISMPAAADDFMLGTVSAPSSVPIQRTDLVGAFTDHFSFTVGAGQTVGFSSSFDTGYWSVAYLDDFAASLVKNGVTVATGSLHIDTLPEGWPDWMMSFASQTLTAGDYVMVVTGTQHSVFPDGTFPMVYNGTIDFADGTASAVPEPPAPASWLMGLALLALVLTRARRSQD